ncbi:unnamed protein product [Pedinophyceae sp. YPF-701]|nr:unnamed protein product [Pedinophyceae sp. YPF-701]
MASNTPGTTEAGMDVAKGGWFTELSVMWPGQGLSIQVGEVLYRGRSQFQDICVFQSEAFGKVLLLDGVIQCTEKDEFSYQEMITHLPLQALRHEPKKVLVVGGGDGGVLRELRRYPSIEEIHIAEIDEGVIKTAKEHFPSMAIGFEDPRVKVTIGDGLQFVAAAAPDTYDAIIVDSSDPVGPAEVLYEKPFYESMYRALAPGGVVCTQAESLWLHMGIIKALASMCAEVYKGGAVSYGFTTIPTYPSGQIGFMMCSKDKDINFKEPKRGEPSTPDGIQPVRYYSHDVHRAAFVLPKFARDELAPMLS